MHYLSGLLLILFVGTAGIRANNGSGIRSLAGSGAAAGGDCPLGSPLVDYNMTALGQANGSAVIGVINSGTGGSAWDIVQASAGLQPTFRTAANCSGSGSADCIDFDGGDLLDMASVETVAWAKTIQCSTGYFLGNTAATIEFAVTHAVSAAGSNSLRETTAGADFKLNTSSALLFTSAAVHTICADFTNMASVDISVDGSTVVTSANLGGGGATDPDFYVLGSYRSAGGFYFNGELHRVMAYNADPGLTIDELSSCGQERVGL